MSWVRACYALLATLLLVSCSSSADLVIVRSRIMHFHELMAEEQFGQIYAEASDELKKSTTEKQLTDVLSAINRKLGNVKEAKDSGWKVDFRTSGTVVTLR